jgi:hypothetical protein
MKMKNNVWVGASIGSRVGLRWRRYLQREDGDGDGAVGGSARVAIGKGMVDVASGVAAPQGPAAM